jgi:hypothetical protein
MSTNGTSPHLTWLFAKVVASKDRVARLFGKMRGLLAVSAPEGMKSSVHYKFISLMDEVATEHDREIRILSQIDELEQRHRNGRQAKKLKCAEPDVVKEKQQELQSENVTEKQENGLLKFLFFWRFFLADENDEPKQDFKPD